MFRCRTTNNMLGDCYGAAIVEKLSSQELSLMDKLDQDQEGEYRNKMESNHDKDATHKEMTSI